MISLSTDATPLAYAFNRMQKIAEPTLKCEHSAAWNGECFCPKSFRTSRETLRNSLAGCGLKNNVHSFLVFNISYLLLSRSKKSIYSSNLTHGMPRGVAPRSQHLQKEGMIAIGHQARQLAAQGKDVVLLSVGDPMFESPPQAVEAACHALRTGRTHYCDSHGTLSLRNAAAAYLSEIRQSPGLIIDPNLILVGPGAKPLIFSTMMALLAEGDEAIYPNPGFPSFEQCIQYAGAVAVPCPLREERDFRMDPADVRSLITPRTKLLVLNSPHNPTGAVLTKQDVQEMAQIAVEHDLYVLSDEIYSRNVYPGSTFHSILLEDGMLERTIVLDGPIKSLAMTGWRVGFALFPAHLEDYLYTLHMNLWSCLPEFTQEGAAVALLEGKLKTEEMNAEYLWRRDMIVDRVSRMPLVKKCTTPAGAFYVFFSVLNHLIKVSAETDVSTPPQGLTSRICEKILDQQLVTVVPGSCFGKFGEGCIRIAYCSGSRERLEEGLRRLEAGLQDIAINGL